MEAALSQGFTYISAMRLIILPQAFRIILPPLTNQIVNLIKTPPPSLSSLGGLDVCDQVLVSSQWKLHSSLLGAALLYFSLCFPVAQFGRKMEQTNKNLFTLGGYYGIHFRSFDPR